MTFLKKIGGFLSGKTPEQVESNKQEPEINAAMANSMQEMIAKQKLVNEAIKSQSPQKQVLWDCDICKLGIFDGEQTTKNGKKYHRKCWKKGMRMARKVVAETGTLPGSDE